ncbi:MAG: hypothetical protein ABSH23_07035 [Steroidobacteraceae bacterium]
MRWLNAAPPLVLCAALTGCALHWPWRHRAAPPPAPVQELSIQPSRAQDGDAAAHILQFWDRNTLLLDLTALHGEGTVTLSAPASRGWPVRLEFRVQPGGIARLEVQGSTRVVFEVPPQGNALVLKLAPDAYVQGTAAISLRWSAAADSAR